MKLQSKRTGALYGRIRESIESARSSVARSVNTTQVAANSLTGREIVEEEKKGKARGVYGEKLLASRSQSLTGEFGTGYSMQHLRFIRQFYLLYPALVAGSEIRYAPRSELGDSLAARTSLQKTAGKNLPPTRTAIVDAARQISDALRRISNAARAISLKPIIHAPRGESRKADVLRRNLSWAHYHTLLRR